jgi:hypothetical protein
MLVITGAGVPALRRRLIARFGGRVPVPVACGYQWAADHAAEHDHVCHRTSAEHRAHECACSAVELRTSAYRLAERVGPGSSRGEG